MKRALLAALVATCVAASVSLAAAKPPAVAGNARAGNALFKAQQCGSCHMLAAANAFGGSGAGPDLDHTRKSYAALVALLTRGGPGMAGYKGVLTATQIQDLAAFVYTAAHPR